jgi:hypothetical protein
VLLIIDIKVRYIILSAKAGKLLETRRDDSGRKST